MVIALTHFGYIKRMPIDTYKAQRRGGRGITGISTREEDFVEQLFISSTHSTILFFTNLGKVFRLKGYEVPEAGRTAKGTAIVNLLQLNPGEKITTVIPVPVFAEGQYLLMATKDGLIKKTNLMEYANVRKSGLQGINLREEDELIDVRLTDGENDLVLVTKQGMSIKFNEKDVRTVGRVSQGVIGMKLNDDDKLIGMEIIQNENDYLLAITENGFGKRTELEEYRHRSRAGKGVITYKITEKTGELVAIKIVKDTDDVMLITDTGVIIRMNVDEISVLGRSTQGVTLLRTNDGGKVVSVEKVVSEEDEENLTK
jgi:DNA gyrase subunit A